MIATTIILIVLFFGTISIYIKIGNLGIYENHLIDEAANVQKVFFLSQEEAEELTQRSPIQESIKNSTSNNQKLMELVTKLEVILKDRPNDLRGHKLLAKNSANIGNFVVARKAQSKVMELLGEKTGSGDYTDLAEYMLSAAGGYV